MLWLPVAAVGEVEDHRLTLPSLRLMTLRRIVGEVTAASPGRVLLEDESLSTRGDVMAALEIMILFGGCEELSPVWSLALAYTISTNPAAGNKDLLMTL